MNIKVKVDKSKAGPLRDQGDKALDKVWATEKWVKLPMNFDKDVIDNLDKIGLLIGGRCSLVVVAGERKMVNTVRNVISALPESAGFPRCLFVDDTLSPKALEKVLMEVRQNNIVLIGVTDGKETKTQVANFKILEDFVKEKYTEDKIKSHIYFICGSEKSPFRQMAEEGGYSVMTNTDIFSGEEGILTPAVLLIMAIVGYSIDDFIKGCEDMVSDPAWDSDGKDYAINMYLRGQEITGVYDYELLHLAGINGKRAVLLPGEMDEVNTLIQVEENDIDILLPSSPFYEEESLREMMNKEKEENMEKFEAVISLDRLDAYNIGQLSYFLLLSQAIKENM